MRNVLVDMHRLKYHPFNGLYTFSYHLGKALAAIKSADLQLYYYVPPGKKGIFGTDQQYTLHKSFDKYWMPGTSKFDVWHRATTLSWYKPFNNKTKLIFTLHDLNFLIEEKDNLSRNKRLLKQIQERVNRANHLVGISQFALDFVGKHINFGNKPTSVIYNGCINPTHAGIETPSYKPNRKFIFSVGLIQPRKNFHVLPALLQKNKDLELVIAGLNEFGYGEAIMQAAKKMGVANRVILSGPISEAEKCWYYSHCEAFCFPSIAEGFGLPVLEAMYFGKPVFLANATSLPEIGGNVAWYFNSFEPEAMQKIFEEGMQEYYSKHPQEKIQQRAAQFSWLVAAEQYCRLYKTVE
jgi:glycosyltransferase involved in cell wall biosynthesis